MHFMTDRTTLFSVKEAAEKLRVTTKTIRRWAQKHTLPGMKVGPRGDWRFTSEDLNKVTQRKEVNTV